MSKIPTYFARKPMETVRYARAPAGITDVGAGLEAEAITRFGSVLSRIAEKFQQAKDLTDVTEAQTNALKEFSRLENQYALDQDYTTIFARWNKDVDKSRKTILKKKGLSGEARRAIEREFDRDRVRFSNEIRTLVRRKQIYDGQMKFYEGLRTILEEYEGEDVLIRAEALIAGTERAELITPLQADRHRASLESWYERVTREKLYKSVWDVALTMSYEEAVKYVTEQEDLNVPDRKSIISSLAFFESKKQKRAERTLTEMREADIEDLINKLDTDELDYGHIDSRESLTESEKGLWKKRASKEYKEKPAITDWDNYLAAEQAITNYYTGRTSKTEAKDALLKERYDNRKLSKEHYELLKARLDVEYPSWLAESIATAHRSGKKTIGGWWLYGGEKKRLADYNKAILDWVDKQIKDGKDISAEDVYIQSRKLAPFYAVGKTPPEERIRIKSPDGTIGTIPESQLENALKEGYTIAED